ncbi:actin interacting protein 3-domain-containing protein [Cladochytrium replicatum]|nr:actin interacting protein 3-domain-containing protein [Cladochytrium replicatum]
MSCRGISFGIGCLALKNHSSQACDHSHFLFFFEQNQSILLYVPSIKSYEIGKCSDTCLFGRRDCDNIPKDSTSGRAKSLSQGEPSVHSNSRLIPNSIPYSSIIMPSPRDPVQMSTSRANADLDLVLFLQVDDEVRKVSLHSSILPQTDEKLRQLFAEKFPFSGVADVDSNSNNPPLIYIRDEKSREFYRLEDMSEIQDRSFLRLHYPSLTPESLKKHLDQSLASIMKEFRDFRKTISSDSSTNQTPTNTTGLTPNNHPKVPFRTDRERSIRRPSNAQVFSALLRRDLTPSSSSTNPAQRSMVDELRKQQDALAEFRRSIAVMRQTFNQVRADTAGSIADLLQQVSTSRQKWISSPNSERMALLSAKEKLEIQNKILRERLNSLKEIVEDMKADVTVRRSRPGPYKMDYVVREALELQTDLAEFTEFVDEVKPSWKRVWEEELKKIVDEQNFLKKQQQASQDFEDAHAEMVQVFQALQQVVEMQESSPPEDVGLLIDVVPAEEAGEVMGGVLEEVKMAVNLQHDSERRLLAIAKAEKVRRWERDELTPESPFESELRGFIREGKWKMTGGVEEVERRRKAKDLEVLRLMNASSDGKKNSQS